MGDGADGEKGSGRRSQFVARPLEGFELPVERRFDDVVDVVADGLHGDSGDHLQHLCLGEAGVQEGLEFLSRNEATVGA